MAPIAKRGVWLDAPTGSQLTGGPDHVSPFGDDASNDLLPREVLHLLSCFPCELTLRSSRSRGRMMYMIAKVVYGQENVGVLIQNCRLSRSFTAFVQFAFTIKRTSHGGK